MSTFVYAQLAQQKKAVEMASAAPEATAPGTQALGVASLGTTDAAPDTAPPAGGNVSNYVEALSALIPAEVLTLHALILSQTTKIEQATGGGDSTLTTISDPQTLKFAFYGLLLMSFLLYAAPRLYGAWRAAGNAIKGVLAQLDAADLARAVIPPLAFVAWSMLQRATAFDAAYPWISESQRTVSGLFLASALVAAASWLAFKRPNA
jgi:hypothetical protein